VINLKIIAGIKYFTIILFTALIVFNLGCNKPTEPNTGNVTMAVEDASCTEVWLKITAGSNALVQDYTLFENENKKLDITLKQRDTVITIENLFPKHNYRYKLMNPNNVSNEVLAITLDTTSHNFTWQTFEFGEYGNSVLYDVAIINENNIWAVGEIYMNDSNGNPDPTFYNAVHWNGTEWELKKIFYKGGIWTIRTIFAFNGNDIWFSGYMRYLNGQFIELTIPNILRGWQINKLWGSSSNDLYAVGDNGNIAHYNGSGWTKIESPVGTSGTDVDLLDVWGSPDGKTVWVCGENLQKTNLLKIKNNQTEIVFEGSYPMQTVKNRFSDGLLSLWTNSSNFIYVLSPYNLYRCKTNTTGEGEELYPYNDYFRGAYIRIRGTEINNLFTTGNKSTITHYNGVSWKIYDELISEYQYLVGLAVKENMIVSVGEKFEGIFDYKAVIIVGKK
jgi:hypothetical protein